MARRSSSKPLKTERIVDQPHQYGQKHQQALVSPKSNWVSNVQALKGTGIAKVGESFDEGENVPFAMKPVKTTALLLKDRLDEPATKPPDSQNDKKSTSGSKNTKISMKDVRPKAPLLNNKPLQTASTRNESNQHSNHSSSTGVAAAPVSSLTANNSARKKVSQINAEAVLSVFASTSPRSLGSSPFTAGTDENGEGNKSKSSSPQGKKAEGKLGGNFKWFRKSRKEAAARKQDQQQQQDAQSASQYPKSPRTPRSIFANLRNPTPSEVTKETTDLPPVPPTFTSPLRQQLWLGVVQKAIAKVVEAPPTDLVAVNHEQVMSEEPEEQMMPPSVENQSSSFYRRKRDSGAYVDYSTFDDGESVSSIDLLFKWLMCRDLTAPEPKTGSTISTSDGDQVESDVSFDPDAQPRRRVLFSP